METSKKLKDVPVANPYLYKETAFRHHISPKQVEEFAHAVGSYINMIIKRGAFETVMIPHFGKFRVKVKKLQGMNDRSVLPILVKKK
jgi:nucleoid DNA-binding protein